MSVLTGVVDLELATRIVREAMRDKWRTRIFSETTRVDGCWIWLGRLDKTGYGRPSYGRTLEQLAHRLSYRLNVGDIPPGQTIDHLCRVRACVNPEHLETVSLRENILRGEGMAAKRARQTHCKHGHGFTAENTYVHPDGRRACRTCRRELRRTRYLETGE